MVGVSLVYVMANPSNHRTAVVGRNSTLCHKRNFPSKGKAIAPVKDNVAQLAKRVRVGVALVTANHGAAQGLVGAREIAKVREAPMVVEEQGVAQSHQRSQTRATARIGTVDHNLLIQRGATAKEVRSEVEVVKTNDLKTLISSGRVVSQQLIVFPTSIMFVIANLPVAIAVTLILTMSCRNLFDRLFPYT